MVKNGMDATSVEGASNLPYALPAIQVDLHSPKLPRAGAVVALGRLDAHGLLDRDASSTSSRRRRRRIRSSSAARCSAKHPRHLARARARGEGSRLGQAARAGQAGEKRGRGVALHESFDSYVAEVAEVTVKADNSFTVDRVVCAVDCGIAVNPDNVRAQMEGGIGYGLSAALYGAITLKDGVVEQSNFHDYPVLRINEAPKIEVHIVPSTAAPSGVGEPGTPVVAPALANAIFAATGKRVRTLPMKLA